MDDSLRAGIAIYNAGAYRAAHGAWESTWLTLENGSDDERFLHGLIQFTAAVHHVHDGNDSGAVGLARSAQRYLDGLDDDYRSVSLGGVRSYLARLEADSGADAESNGGADGDRDAIREDPPELRFDGRVVTYDDLDFEAVVVAAETLAEELDEYDETVVSDAVEYARKEVEDGTQTQFTAMVFDFVQNETQRGLVFQRMKEHVRRKRRRKDDVAGLFD
ncbi:DUF309 domain-containing protein [Haloferax mediterranei ATCC 33500]|uniref:DUF309 domain-containing protein n=1 Tax=Haloferax mediterranei (strain ATCC 33500 / DSM 1411 / JCM 8866 / NBRC 14739 / NCIMB 2177 / R-4) TaxID=523841 RepID=I3R1V9_HALMT|nr:DUF309 domain-containing protein [Haloferax mediterranei]AFK18219.1 hypothetical protein HFX_0487 [Haloferax mediterranei ATCC 33500]AHZ22379.1 hypothetical protein BM92_06830 [Haloferax mediterranei ATCC 33500]EMA02509.1 hypothetical protein C439_08000 [Haloferax mediterranei ATCC 33500]MDX5988307.1 DUF309 domain-containing protein [Haloferax mediterranei ATCC 33500]QCQ74742.1 DUF309 domain-containing protein [Haloferax mediterranei ATCC 33500]